MLIPKAIVGEQKEKSKGLSTTFSGQRSKVLTADIKRLPGFADTLY
jgi:hypothetical protein